MSMASNTYNNFSPSPIARQQMSFLGVGATRASTTLKTYLKSPYHAAGMKFVKWDLGVGADFAKKGFGTSLGKWLGRGFLGFSAYQGYKEGGVGGAVVGVGKHLAASYLIGAALKGLAVTTGITVGAVGGLVGGAAAIGVGLHFANGGRIEAFARPWVKEHMKKHAQLEMATPAVDDYGNIATMRQRSINAIQNSRLNGRNALGNEGALSYTPYL